MKLEDENWREPGKDVKQEGKEEKPEMLFLDDEEALGERRASSPL